MSEQENKEEAIFTIGDVANELGVQSHVVNHYTKNLGDLLGDDLQVDPSNGYRKFTPNGLRVMKVIRRMVQDEKKTLEQVREELDKDRKDNVALPTRLEMDMAQSYAKIANDMEKVMKQTTDMFQVMGFLTKQVEGLAALPNAIKSYHDETQRIILDQQGVMDHLQKQLTASESEKESFKVEVEEMKKQMEEMKSSFQEQLEKSTEHILSEGEKRWATPQIPEKKEKKGFFGFFK